MEAVRPALWAYPSRLETELRREREDEAPYRVAVRPHVHRSIDSRGDARWGLVVLEAVEEDHLTADDGPWNVEAVGERTDRVPHLAESAAQQRQLDRFPFDTRRAHRRRSSNRRLAISSSHIARASRRDRPSPLSKKSGAIKIGRAACGESVGQYGYI